jgi:methylated-DNA-[protein]-cysteine S-methyltransferase
MARAILLKYTVVDTAAGWITIVGSEAGLRRISIHDSPDAATRDIAMHFPEATKSSLGFGDLAERLKQCARGKQVAFDDKLDLANATRFQQAVWEATRTIPYGETRSYGWIARCIGAPKAARAVGQALNRNPFPIVVPCHRVIGKSGGLTGFSCGLDVKRRLLDLEAAVDGDDRVRQAYLDKNVA